MSFVFWDPHIMDGFCVCGDLQGFDDDDELTEGLPVADSFPDDAFFEMSPDFPKDIELGDGVYNGGGYMLVSQRLAALIQGESANAIEALPVTIYNHKGRIASDTHLILNPTDFCDAIDLEQSEIVWNNIDPETISVCKDLVLDEEAVPPEYTVFRLTHFPDRIVMRRELAARIEAGPFTAVAFTDAAHFRGF